MVRKKNTLPEDYFSGDVDNYRGTIPALLIGRLALFCTDIWGTFTAMRLILSGSRRTGQAPSWGGGGGGWHSAPYSGLFFDAPRRRPGINLPSEFGSEFSRLDLANDFKAVPRGSDSTFRFNEPGHSKFFGPKRLAPDAKFLFLRHFCPSRMRT